MDGTIAQYGFAFAFCYLKNDYSYLDEVCHAFRDDNVRGVVCNLYFMSR